VIGQSGQVAQALRERGRAHGCDVVNIGRPNVDLAKPESILASLQATKPDIVVNAAAYTAVDRAEKEAELATAVNGRGAGHVAAAAAIAEVPVIHLSTDYVFDGTLDRPYREYDPTGPASVYGMSKLQGEIEVANATANHAILRTSWVYSPFGNNFVKTMLKLAAGRDEIGVVGDQHGNPTYALDIAEGILAVARNLLNDRSEAMRGVFNMAGASDTDWAQFASAIFKVSAAKGGPDALVKPIATRDYPTAARRPANSRLDCGKLATVHGVSLPGWQQSLPGCIARLLDASND
jgi:dTDP-4-dehydrorhamnose reductase